MRARMALKLADIQVEIREISLRNKPQEMLALSPKGTVPVLLLPDGKVIDESLEIMLFVLKTYALEGNIHAVSMALIAENDTQFKRALDCYKYPERHAENTQMQHRMNGEVFLHKLEALLQQNTYLLSDEAGVVDIAIFPFIRQFAAVDGAWFETAPYPKCRAWLNGLVNSDLFASVMEKHPTFIGGY